jgi:hypothetical protein
LGPSISLRTGFAKLLWSLSNCAPRENALRFFSRDCGIRMTRDES